MTNRYIKLAVKLLLATLPIWLILTLYIISDPFHVIYKYDYCANMNYTIGLNKDYVSTENFINNAPAHHYDSFIFGSSHSMVYKVKSWKEYVRGDDFYHFDAFGESLFGIYKKVLFLDMQKVSIKNALVILDTEMLVQTHNSTGHLFIKDPVTSGESKLAFQFQFFSSIFNCDFLFAYAYFKIFKKLTPYMIANFLLDPDIQLSNCSTNEVSWTRVDSLIDKNPSLYYTKDRLALFLFGRSKIQKYSVPVLAVEQINMLKQIKDVFEKDKTNYRIVINPLFKQYKLNPKDLILLNQIFGKENVFDFSGINGWTENPCNYYEYQHYRPNIADSIMKVVYKNQ